MKKALSLMLIIGLALCLFAACTAVDQTPAGDQGGAQDTPSTGATTPAGDRIVRMAVDSTPLCDPGVGVSYASIYSHVNFYDGLLIPASDNSGEIWPLLAESWDISADGLVYTFNLKEAKFHNGDTVKASDVIFSLNRTIAMGEGYAYLFEGVIKEAVALDDSTVQFTLNETYGPFLSTMVRLYVLNEKQVMENINFNNPLYNYGSEYGDYGRDWLITHDAGSGPYVLTEVRQQEYVHGEQFADYHIAWDAEAPTSIRLVVTGEPSTLRALLANKELEMTDNWQSTEILNAVATVPGVEIGNYSTWAQQDIFYNNRLAPMDDVNYRKGISCLIDYEGIVSVVFPGSKRAIGPVNTTMPGSNLAVVPYEYNLEKAMEYFNASKYAGQLDKYPIEFYCISEVADQEKTALAFQSAAKQVGIPVTITKAPYLNLIERFTTIESTPHLSTLSESPKYNDISGILFNRYSSRTAGTIQQGEWIQSKEFDDMLGAAMKIVDDKQRMEAYQEIQRYIVEDHCFSGYLADIVERVAYNAGYVYWPAAEMSKQGTVSANVIGYPFWFHDFKVLLDKK